MNSVQLLEERQLRALGSSDLRMTVAILGNCPSGGQVERRGLERLVELVTTFEVGEQALAQVNDNPEVARFLAERMIYMARTNARLSTLYQLCDKWPHLQEKIVEVMIESASSFDHWKQLAELCGASSRFWPRIESGLQRTATSAKEWEKVATLARDQGVKNRALEKRLATAVDLDDLLEIYSDESNATARKVIRERIKRLEVDLGKWLDLFDDADDDEIAELAFEMALTACRKSDEVMDLFEKASEADNPELILKLVPVAVEKVKDFDALARVHFQIPFDKKAVNQQLLTAIARLEPTFADWLEYLENGDSENNNHSDELDRLAFETALKSCQDHKKLLELYQAIKEMDSDDSDRMMKELLDKLAGLELTEKQLEALRDDDDLESESDSEILAFVYSRLAEKCEDTVSRLKLYFNYTADIGEDDEVAIKLSKVIIEKASPEELRILACFQDADDVPAELVGAAATAVKK